ncbi:hypothetical protein CLOM_g9336 [Closterium sp. NIES-68]|nr:hypothetical protein CLOM_g4235 [Closterium sp. NIES-68]GJP50195.1 hypothetical protein CLOM_g9336 [Closterium sp. NIES-68]GJP69278.1 hypothetical protein CLOP_g221 [Closterium sp. NIES-67]
MAPRRTPHSPRLGALQPLLLVLLVLPSMLPGCLPQEIVPIPGFGTPEKIAMAEKAALLAFAAAFRNHPIFGQYGGWANVSLGMSYETSRPCVQFWKWITCDEEGRVNSIDMDNAAMVALNPAFARGRKPGPLKGVIPWRQMRALGNLQLLRVVGNDVSGPVLPGIIFRFPKLKEIMFLDNKMVGPMPNTVSALKSLQKLDVSMNRITGAIPPGIATLTSLTWLALSQNRMSGVLPAALGNLRQLRKLDLGGNGFRGPMPPSWGALKRLELINLQKLNLGGPVPAAWLGMVSMKHFVAPAARIRGRFPSGLLRLSQISDIILYNNRLWGPLPPARQLFAPHTLTQLDVRGNYLNGSVPKVPAGRLIDFKYFSNCFLPKPSPKCTRS